MKPKWKCNICSKELSSKQIVANHIKKVHPNSELNDKQYSRVTQGTSDDTNRKTQKKQKKPEKKKTAYASFAGLKNIFSDKTLCQSFSLYPKARNQDNPQHESTTAEVVETSGVREDGDLNNCDTAPVPDSTVSALDLDPCTELGSKEYLESESDIGIVSDSFLP